MDIERLLKEYIGLSKSKYDKCKGQEEHDIRFTYFKIVTHDAQVTDNTLWALHEFSKLNTKEYLDRMGNNAEVRESFEYTSKINQVEKMILDCLFQTEMVMRHLYWKVTGKSSADANMPAIVKELFGEEYGSSEKDYVKVIRLLWAIRNTIHNQGIHNKREEGQVVNYKDVKYEFEYNKPVGFTKNFKVLEFLPDLIDSVEIMFDRNKEAIEKESIKHPFYTAQE